MHPKFSQMFKIGENSLHPGDRRSLAHQLDTVSPQVDLDRQPIFHQTKVLVASAIQRLDSRGKLQGFFYQMEA